MSSSDSDDDMPLAARVAPAANPQQQPASNGAAAPAPAAARAVPRPRRAPQDGQGQVARVPAQHHHQHRPRRARAGAPLPRPAVEGGAPRQHRHVARVLEGHGQPQGVQVCVARRQLRVQGLVRPRQVREGAQAQGLHRGHPAQLHARLGLAGPAQEADRWPRWPLPSTSSTSSLRAGHEKDEDEADTVGCCTLKKTVGPGRRTRDGDLIAPAVKEGDKVLLPEYGGALVKLDSKEVFLYRDEDILGVLTE